MSDSLNTGRKIRAFNVIDDYNRECLGIEVDHSLPAQRVIYSAPTNQDNNLKFLISNELNLTQQFGVKNYE